MLQMFLATLWAVSLAGLGPWHHALHNQQNGGQQVLRQGSSRYYVSAESSDFERASEVCIETYGQEYGLAILNSTQDLKDLKSFLNQYGVSRTEYWIDGAYATVQKQYFWNRFADEGGDNLYFKSFVNDLFKKNLPAPGANTRTTFIMLDKLNPEIRTHQNTELKKFICERRDGRLPIPCRGLSDIAVILDSSGSIGASYFEVAKKISADIVRTFAVEPQNRQLGLVYSHVVKEVLSLKFNGTVAEKHQKMMSAPYLASITNTGAAVQQAYEVLNPNKRQSQGYDVPQIMVVITDGGSSDPSVLARAVKLAEAANIRKIAVGVGSQINKQELDLIAGPDGETFYADDWEALEKMLQDITQSMCPKNPSQQRF